MHLGYIPVVNCNYHDLASHIMYGDKSFELGNKVETIYFGGIAKLWNLMMSI
jgi:hypothetical protein